jgi:hypothetical protein
MMLRRFFIIPVLALGIAGCTTLVARDETGVIIARRAQIRSSIAVVAADLKEVERGEMVEILGSDTAENGEQWLRVRTFDGERVEGWIEARNVMSQEMLNRSRKLAEEDKDVPAQATGQLRASTNLRLTPDRSTVDNIMMKLDSGATFEIVGWKYVPKPKSSEATDIDDAPKPGSAQRNPNRRSKESDEPKGPEETNELWYKVRLAKTISPAPAGWLYGKQVELTVPGDIIFYRTGREFVAWCRLDDEAAGKTATKDKDAAKDGKPGSWVILEKSSSRDRSATDEPDFDRIYVLGYDESREEHYTAYRSADVNGRLPLRVGGSGVNKYFTVNILQDNQIKQARYNVTRDEKGLLHVEAANDVAKGRKKR